MRDPLLPTNNDTAGTTTATTPQINRTRTTTKSRRPGPAISAKILATGLATTATLGLTAGYALASKPQAPAVPATGTPGINNAPASSAPNLAAPQDVTPTNSSPVVTAPSTPSASAQSDQQVVEITVPTIAPAQPGNNWSGGNQPSSGSN